MNMQFDATTYNAFVEDEVRILGLADDPAQPGQYLLLQRAEHFDEQDEALGMATYHVELGGQGVSGYGGIEQVLLAPGQLTLHFSQAVAWCRSLPSLEIRWETGLLVPDELEAALTGIFSETSTVIQRQPQ
ncbi:MAG: Imm10 family immunity protein [Pseudomonas sp.]|uniref:Imm10 family immunity protein n=1 Tax=Pseudomonas sp. TaxID=306 RepID=UPI00073166F1|nr:hypothetical protein AO265_02770 [Pseudomonas sp. ABAC61]